MTRDEQFSFIGAARFEILKWSASEGIDLFRVEFIVPFVETDFGLSVWFFYTKNNFVTENEKNDVSEKLKERFLEILKHIRYSKRHLAEINFVFDSNENVEKNYEGSYFYRLR